MDVNHDSGPVQALGANRDVRPVVVQVHPVFARLQRFKHLHPVSWATLLLLAGELHEGADEADAIRRALISIAEASEHKRRTGAKQRSTATRNLTGVRDLLKGLAKPGDLMRDPVVVDVPQPDVQEFFSRVFKLVPLWQSGHRVFGLALDKRRGLLILVDHDEMQRSSENAPLVAHVEVKQPHAATETSGNTAGRLTQSRDETMSQQEPRLGQLESLDSFRDVIKGGVRLKGWRVEEIDAPIRNQMLFIDRETSGLPDVLSDDPTARDEPLMTLVKRMSQWPQCFRFLHSGGTLVGYVSSAPLHDERTLKSRDPVRHDLNLLREDVWWGAGDSGDTLYRPKALYLSSVRLLERDHDRDNINRMLLMNAVESITIGLAEDDGLYFDRLYVCVHQPHARQACIDMINHSIHAKQEELAERAGYLKLHSGVKLRGLRRVHLAPEWCVADGHLERLKDVYRKAGKIK